MGERGENVPTLYRKIEVHNGHTSSELQNTICVCVQLARNIAFHSAPSGASIEVPRASPFRSTQTLRAHISWGQGARDRFRKLACASMP